MKPDESRQAFQALLDEKNFLGAYGLLRQEAQGSVDLAIEAGYLVEAILREIEGCRKRDELERVRYLRSLATYTLRDWPGLQSLYQEENRSARRDPLNNLVQGLKDSVQGKQNIDATIKEGLEGIRQSLQETGLPVDELSKNLGQGVKDGIRGLENFFDSVQASFTTPTPSKKSGTEASEQGKYGQESGPQAQQRGIKIAINKETSDAPGRNSPQEAIPEPSSRSQEAVMGEKSEDSDPPPPSGEAKTRAASKVRSST